MEDFEKAIVNKNKLRGQQIADTFEKARALPIGTIKQRPNGNFIKTVNGWKYHSSKSTEIPMRSSVTIKPPTTKQTSSPKGEGQMSQVAKLKKVAELEKRLKSYKRLTLPRQREKKSEMDAIKNEIVKLRGNAPEDDHNNNPKVKKSKENLRLTVSRVASLSAEVLKRKGISSKGPEAKQINEGVKHFTVVANKMISKFGKDVIFHFEGIHLNEDLSYSLGIGIEGSMYDRDVNEEVSKKLGGMLEQVLVGGFGEGSKKNGWNIYFDIVTGNAKILTDQKQRLKRR